VKMLDGPEFFDALRADTSRLLGFSSVDGLAPSQSLKVDIVSSLRLELDRVQAAQLRGEPIDMKVLMMAGEMLERLLRPAEAVVAGADQFSDARERLAQLIDGLAGAAEHEQARVEREEITRLKAEVESLRAMLQRGSVPGDVTPEALPSPAVDPEEAKKCESARILAEMTKPRDEPWRPFVDASGIRTSHGNFNVHGIPKGW
jgi:hypothetical protein